MTIYSSGKWLLSSDADSAKKHCPALLYSEIIDTKYNLSLLILSVKDGAPTWRTARRRYNQGIAEQGTSTLFSDPIFFSNY